ncbi:MAG: AAA family ATPase [Actinomycetota bacterium]|nr:AAA family ATPase [Actinomycetota bacterium]
MRVESVVVRKLFGIYTHEVPLNREARITIIYGPNGVGKTTLLRMIDHLFGRSFSSLLRVTFAEFVVNFADTTSVSVRKLPDDVSRHEARPINTDPGPATIIVNEPSGTQAFDWGPPEVDPPFPFGVIERELPLRRIGPSAWRDRRGRRLSLQDVVEQYADDFPPLLDLKGSPEPAVAELLDRLTVHFIETQRLLRVIHDPETYGRPQDGVASAVVQHAKELAGQIQRDLARSAQLSQQLDRTFPNRLLTPSNRPPPPPEAIRERFALHNDRRNRLMEAALLDMGEEVPLPERELDDPERRILWTYLEDVEQKLSVFDRLLSRIELFKEIINSRFVNKRILVDNQGGFRFETDQGLLLSPDDLSSGEQHELVLTYHLLFRAKEGSLVLIDEPEISLHVTWQQKFLEDVERIARVADLDFILATHSPQVIHDRWDLAVALKARG